MSYYEECALTRHLFLCKLSFLQRACAELDLPVLHIQPQTPRLHLHTSLHNRPATSKH